MPLPLKQSYSLWSSTIRVISIYKQNAPNGAQQKGLNYTIFLSEIFKE